MEDFILEQKKYLVEVLGKKLIDSDERDDRFYGYRVLAKKYWPEEFEDGKRKHVHHIDFDNTNNVVSNLVVLTGSEHRIIHYLFDQKSKEIKEKISETLKGRKLPEDTRIKMSVSRKGIQTTKGKHWKLSEETRKKQSEAKKGIPKSKEHRQKISKTLKNKHIANNK